jgi:hypothetical protein
MKTWRSVVCVVLVGLALGLAGCETAAPTRLPILPTASAQQPASETKTASDTLAPQPTQPLPSATPTAPAQPVVLLILPSAGDARQPAAVQKILTGLADTAKYQLKSQTSLSEADLRPEVKIVVLLQVDPGFAQLLSKAPAVQFLAIDIPNLTQAPNLSQVGGQVSQAEKIAFTAGYLAALVTPDWRAGLLDAAGLPFAGAYTNGLRFFCGLCRPAFPPFIANPQSAEVASPKDAASAQAGADLLVSRSVRSVFVPPSVSSPEVLTYCAKSGLNLIATESPPAEIASRWIATIRQDFEPGILQAWPLLLEGKGGQYAAASILLTDVNPQILGAARQRLAQQMLDELNQGRINPNLDSQP